MLCTTGNYRFKNVRAPREHNQEDWKRDNWVDMVAELDNDRFRWFDSGDVYDVRLARKICKLCNKRLGSAIGYPLACISLQRTGEVLAQMSTLPNVVVRFSSDSITGNRRRPSNVHHCDTRDNPSQCPSL